MGIAHLLLDTNALLWSLLSPQDLSQKALTIMRDPGTQLLVSSVSAWEIAIKHALGKLEGAKNVVTGFSEHLGRLQADVLVITPEHALRAGALPRHHRDPFDRMLIAQAQLERVPLVTSDALFSSYEVEVIW